MIIGATGHQGLLPAVMKGVRDLVMSELAQFPEPTGVCSLAAGSDQLFAQLVLEVGGALMVVVPCTDYEATFTDENDLESYRALLRRATSVDLLDFPAPSEEAFLAAGHRVADLADRVLAVWDGKPARGRGGTADIVEYARELGKDVVVVWPGGAVRA